MLDISVKTIILVSLHMHSPAFLLTQLRFKFYVKFHKHYPRRHAKHYKPTNLFSVHTIIMPSLWMRKLRHGEVMKLAQGDTVCEFCAGSMVTVLWLGRNFIDMGPSTLGALKC